MNNELRNITFILDNVPDYETLAAGVNSDTGVYVLNTQEDVLSQMKEVLSQYNELDALHLVSHGNSGSLNLGDVQLSSSNLDEYKEILEQIGASLNDDGDIFIYGCNVAEGEKGETFVKELAEITGADIAASDDATGASKLGGDWELEFDVGDIEKRAVFNESNLESFTGSLADVTISSTSPTGDGVVNISDLGQSFTATSSDSLTKVRVSFDSSYSGNLEIYSGAGNGGTKLHTQAVNIADTYDTGTANYTLSEIVIDSDVPVVSGNVYTIFFPGSSDVGLSTSNYSGGEVYLGPVPIGGDILFEVVQGSFSSDPTITSATYNASTGVLVVTGTDFTVEAGADVIANKFTITGEGGATYTLTDSANVEIDSATQFTLVLSATDKAAINQIVNKDGTTSTGGTTFDINAAAGFMADSAATSDTDANAITVSNVATPTITSATYDYSSGALVVTGTGFLKKSGAANDIDISKFTITGEGGTTYTITSASDVEITNGTTFSISLSGTDLTNVEALLNADGTTSATTGTTYNLAAAEDWAAGAAVNVVDATGNGITVSNYASPVITSTTYDWSTGALVLTGTNFVNNSGASNDIDASLFTFTGENANPYTLTDTADVEITSATSATIILSANDQLNVHGLLNKDGTTSATSGTTYNVAAAGNWMQGSPTGNNIADATTGVTVSNVGTPTITSATYDAVTTSLFVTGTGFFSKFGANNDIDVSLLTLKGGNNQTYTLLTSSDVDIDSETQFTVNITGNDENQLWSIFDQLGQSSSFATTYDLQAADHWLSGADIGTNISDVSAENGVSVLINPQIISATYNASTGVVVVTGSNIQANGGGSDIDASTLTFTGEAGAIYKLTDTSDVERDSITQFTLVLSATDKAAINALLHKSGTSSADNTTYNLAVADDWNTNVTAGDTSDTTGNAITVANIAPVVDLNGTGSGGIDVALLHTTGYNTPTIADTGATLSDVNTGDSIVSLTATLTARPDGDSIESLSLNATATTAATGLTVNYTEATGILSITGSASISVYETILKGIEYNNSNSIVDTTPGDRIIDVIVNDGNTNSTTSTSTINVVRAPIVTLPNAEYQAGDGATLEAATATVLDPDGDDINTLHIKLTNSQDVGNEFITLNGIGDGSAVNGMNIFYISSTEILLFGGISADYQVMLRKLQYENTSINPDTTTRTIDILASDVNGYESTTTLNLSYITDNTAPTFTNLDGTPTYTEGTAAVVLDADVTIADTELDTANNYDGATLTLARDAGANNDDVFAHTSNLSALTEASGFNLGGADIGTVTTNSNGTLVLTFNATATAANVDEVLQSIAYSNSSSNPDATAQINWTFSDGNTGAQGTGGALSATGSTTVNISAVNNAPTFTNLDGTPTYTEGTAAVVLDADVTIADTELDTANNYSGATLTLVRNGSTDSDDVFSHTSNLSTLNESSGFNLGGADIGTVTTNSNGTLLLTFNATATAANVDEVLQSIAYSNSSSNPDATAQINWTFSDGNTGAQGTGGALSATGSITVSITDIIPVPTPTPTPPTPTPEPEPTLIDGTPVEQEKEILPDGTEVDKTTIAPVSTNREETDDTTPNADIPLHFADEAHNTTGTSLGLAEGTGAEVLGTAEAGRFNTQEEANEFVETLIEGNDYDTDRVSNAVSNFINGLGSEDVRNLATSSVTLTTTSDTPPTDPISIVGTPSGEEGAVNEVLIIDASALPPGTVLDLRDIEFAIIIGPATLTGGEGENIVYGGAGSQTIILGPDDDELYGGDGDDIVGSKGGDDLIFGENGNDTLFGGEGDDQLHGGLDTDKVTYEGNIQDYEITRDGGKTLVKELSSGDVDTIINVETIEFADETYTVENDTDLSIIATLYKQILDRQADLDGFQYWNHDTLDIPGIATSFLRSQEYKEKSNNDYDSMGNEEKVELFYNEFLDRDSDAEGKAYWLQDIANGATFEDVVTNFVNSEEMQGNYLSASEWDFIA